MQDKDWISVKDKLPEDGIMCLTYSSYRYADDCVDLAFYNKLDKVFTFFGEADIFYHVEATHWMPLPERPKYL